MKIAIYFLFFMICTIQCFPQWETIACENIGPTIINMNLYSVAFKDSINGIVVGKDIPPYGIQPKGYILKTIDGGWNWDTTLIVDSMQFRKVIIVDSMTLYAVGGFNQNRGVVAKSMDFGNSWILTFFEDNISSVYFTEDSIGYITSIEGSIYKTIDFGNNWTNIYTSLNNRMISLGFFDNQNGIVCGDSILTTHDGGSTWQNLALFNPYDYEAMDVSIINNQIGYFGHGTTLLKSIDSGYSWDTVGQLSNYINDLPVRTIFFPNDSIGYIAVQHYFYKSEDYGLTWEQQSATIIGSFWDDFHDNYFLNSEIGFMVGRRQFYKTFYGGEISLVGEIRNDDILNIFPNPTNELLYIDVGDNKIERIIIVDIRGRIIFESNNSENQKIDISNIESGIYFVNIFINNRNMNRMIIVK